MKVNIYADRNFNMIYKHMTHHNHLMICAHKRQTSKKQSIYTVQRGTAKTAGGGENFHVREGNTLGEAVAGLKRHVD